MLQPNYLVRYGVMGHVGRFSGSLDGDAAFQRGQAVVIETERGVELGEVLTMVEASGAGASGAGSDENEAVDDCDRSTQSPRAEALRLATADEIDRVHRAERARTEQFQLCQRVLERFDWPWELIDVETLLDDRTWVLHYLGPLELDAAALRAWFRTAHDVDLVFEASGTDESIETTRHAPGALDGHGCGASGCGGGGCGSGADARASSAEPSAASSAHGCGTSNHSGCSSCGIMRAMTERNQRRG